HIRHTGFAVAIYHIVNGSIIAFPEYRYMDDSFTYKYLVLDLSHDKLPVFPENNNFVKIRTVAYVFIFLKSGTYKTVQPVDVILDISQGDLSGGHFLKGSKFSFALSALTVFCFEHLKPGDSIVGQVFQMILYLLDFVLVVLHLLISLFYIKASDATHRLVDELFVIFRKYRAIKLWKKWFKKFV